MIGTRALDKPQHGARVTESAWVIDSDEFPGRALSLSSPHPRRNTEGLLVKTLLHGSTVAVLVNTNNPVSTVSSLQSGI